MYAALACRRSADLGGASGGLVLQPIYENGTWGWRLVGVISEAIMAVQFERDHGGSRPFPAAGRSYPLGCQQAFKHLILGCAADESR